MPSDINIFLDLFDGRTGHKYEMMFWDQSQNRLSKISKNHGLSHQD
jgi:hypothetical protein